MRLVKIAILLLGLSLLAAGLLVQRAYESARRPFKGYPEDEAFFTVERGAPGARVAEQLEQRGIVRDGRLFVLVLRLRELRGEPATIQAGEYRFHEPLSTFEVLDRLAAGDVFTFAVTVPEGLTLLETAEHLAGQGISDANALRASFERSEAIADLDPGASNLEGYLYPTTYHFTRSIRAEEVARTMVAQFKQIFDPGRRSKAKELGFTAREVVTLASVVEKETALAEERPLIGSVFRNRLGVGMPLQSDPTIIYALKIQGQYDGNLTRAHLELDSPYNTYRFAGLPPGPIASPGEESIDGVLEPAESSYLYFVSRNDGSHHFSRTYREHVNAVRKYQVEYFRSRRRNGGDGAR